MKKIIAFVSIFVVIIDQLTKFLVKTNINLNESIDIIKDFFSIDYVQNTGAAFSIFDGGRWFFVVLAVFAIFAIIRYVILDKNIIKGEAVTYGLLLGGIAGNLIDRIIHGYVIDFFHFRLFESSYPVFNVADIAVIIGAFLTIWYIVFNRGKKRENNRSR